VEQSAGGVFGSTRYIYFLETFDPFFFLCPSVWPFTFLKLLSFSPLYGWELSGSFILGDAYDIDKFSLRQVYSSLSLGSIPQLHF
jgi:hypothetical protein